MDTNNIKADARIEAIAFIIRFAFNSLIPKPNIKTPNKKTTYGIPPKFSVIKAYPANAITVNDRAAPNTFSIYPPPKSFNSFLLAISFRNPLEKMARY